MYFFLPIVIGLELVISALLIKPSDFVKQSPKNTILGVKIAQNGIIDTTLIPDLNSQPLPTDQPTGAPTPTPDTTPQPSPTDLSPLPTPTNSPVGSTESSSPTATPIELTNPSDTSAVINPDSVINSTDDISQETVNDVEDEEDTIEKTTDGLAQNQILVNITNNNVLGISKKIDGSDWSNVNFTLQRLNDTLTRASSNGKLTDQQKTVVNARLATLCNVSDPILRASSLIVPEDLQQDVEINQAKCLEIQQ